MGNVRRLAGFLFPAWLALAACAPPASQNQGVAAGAAPPIGPKKIIMINSAIPPGLDNRFVVTSNNAAGIILGLYAGKLITADPNTSGLQVPRLAEAVPSLENGLWKLLPDSKMETRLTLKPGVLWHDGTPVTTRDIVFNDDVYSDKTLPQKIDSARAFIEKMTAVDDRTLSIRWNQPYILADAYSPDMMPAHILEQTFRENSQSLNTHPWLAAEYVGTGPFKLKEFEPGAWVTLTAFDRYVLGRPKLDEIQVRFVVDGGTMLANVLSGEADFTTGTGPSVGQAQELKSQGWDGQITVYPGSSVIHLFGNYIDPVNPVLADKRFKKGLMHSVDRQALVDVIQYGYSAVAHISLPPDDVDYETIMARVEKYPYDPRRAAQMFQDVGYSRGLDGLLQSTATGRRLEDIEFRTTAEQVFQVQMLAAMSGYFREAGMVINEVPIPQQRTADRVYRITNPGLEVLMGGGGRASYIGWNTCPKVPTAQNNYTSGNYPRYCNEQWDEMINRYAVTIPTAERTKVLTDIIAWSQDSLMDAPIIYSVSVQFASKRMIVPQKSPIPFAETWDLK